MGTEQHVHTTKFHYLPQQDDHIPNACGERLLALLTPGMAQELSGSQCLASFPVSFTNTDVDSVTGDKPIHLPLLECQVALAYVRGVSHVGNVKGGLGRMSPLLLQGSNPSFFSTALWASF